MTEMTSPQHPDNGTMFSPNQCGDTIPPVSEQWRHVFQYLMSKYDFQGKNKMHLPYRYRESTTKCLCSSPVRSPAGPQRLWGVQASTAPAGAPCGSKAVGLQDRSPPCLVRRTSIPYQLSFRVSSKRDPCADFQV